MQFALLAVKTLGQFVCGRDTILLWTSGLQNQTAMIVRTYGFFIIITAGFLVFTTGDVPTTSATVQFRNTTTAFSSSSGSNIAESGVMSSNSNTTTAALGTNNFTAIIAIPSGNATHDSEVTNISNMTTAGFATNNSSVIPTIPPGNTTRFGVLSSNSSMSTATSLTSKSVAVPTTPPGISSSYDILEATPDGVSSITRLPCWSDGGAARRAGRIVLKRKDFLKGSAFRLSFRFFSCKGEGYFAAGPNQVDFSEDLYIDVRSDEMDPSLALIDQEFVTVSSKYRLYSGDDYDAEVYVPFSETIKTSRRHFHAIRIDNTPAGVWTDGPEFQVFLYRLPLVFFNATNNFTLLDGFHNTSIFGMNITASTTFSDLNDPDLMEKDLLTIDYTVVLRPRGRVNTIHAARNFQQANINDMSYCPSFRGFIPKQLCPNSMHNTLGTTSCPQRFYVSDFISSVIAQSETTACWNMSQTISTLVSVTTESSTPSTRRTTWKPSNSYDTYYDYRMLGISVALAATFLSFGCALLRYCCRSYARRRVEALAAQGIYRVDNAPSSRRNSEDGPMVYGACHPRQLDSPPSYEEVIRSGCSTPVEKGSSNNLMGFGNEAMSAPTVPVLVIGPPSRGTIPIDSDSSS